MRTLVRWSIPAALATALVGGSLVVPQLASADPELPPTTAAELLVAIAEAEPVPFSATVVHTTDLGLPELPRDSHGSSDVAALLGGTTTARVWSDGPERSRVSVLGQLAETGVVRNGDDVWVWRSDDRTAKHAVVPPHEEHDGAPPVGALTPQEAAERALAMVDPTTEVTVDGTARVAGRDAYDLVLTPKDEGTLVGQVRLAVDAGTSLPLRVQVLARGATAPALETGFTSLSLSRPDPAVFEFTPPEGATVTEVTPPHDAGGQDAREHGAPPAAEQEPTVVGDGWTSVLVLRGAQSTTGPARSQPQDGTLQALLDAFRPVSGEFGTGRVLGTSLVSVLALDDGRVLVGMVPPQALQEAALDPSAAPAP